MVFIWLMLGLTAGPALAEDAEAGNLKLIELYTSHGCSSCPSAESLLADLLVGDDQLLALEFHVDYWNFLVHGEDGSFTDPFSHPSHSTRQREYNGASLKGRPGVYTPQAVINGRFAVVGSDRRLISKALAQTVEQSFKVSIHAGPNPGALAVTLNGSDAQRRALKGTDIVVAHYLDKAVTKITGGENRHKTAANHRVVTRMEKMGEVLETGDMSFQIAKPGDNEGCVVLVQENALTPVYSAAACP